MLLIVGSIVVLASVMGGFLLSHGHILALWQPYELLIIGGSAFGSFLTSNPPKVVKEALRGLISILGGPQYKRGDYLDILSLMHEILAKARKQGLMSIENDIEDPGSSPLFSAFPRIVKDHHLLEFITDCLRLMVTGNMNPHELEPLLEAELETHHHESLAPAHALTKLADSLPGFGIVAAVLGIVTTMASIGGEVALVGEHVAGALVGTFLGILLAYGFVGPIASAMEQRANEDGKAMECVKMALLASLRGYNPTVAIEFARKSLSSNVRPNFADLETHLKGKH
ncbi:MAG: flagellar motor stator protein MotA [Nevskia sp.]|nr:flagellar motor stator protein MotA [Nevskia sp.]